MTLLTARLKRSELPNRRRCKRHSEWRSPFDVAVGCMPGSMLRRLLA